MCFHLKRKFKDIFMMENGSGVEGKGERGGKGFRDSRVPD